MRKVFRLDTNESDIWINNSDLLKLVRGWQEPIYRFLFPCEHCKTPRGQSLCHLPAARKDWRWFSWSLERLASMRADDEADLHPVLGDLLQAPGRRLMTCRKKLVDFRQLSSLAVKTRRLNFSLANLWKKVNSFLKSISSLFRQLLCGAVISETAVLLECWAVKIK